MVKIRFEGIVPQKTRIVIPGHSTKSFGQCSNGGRVGHLLNKKNRIIINYAKIIINTPGVNQKNPARKVVQNEKRTVQYIERPFGMDCEAQTHWKCPCCTLLVNYTTSWKKNGRGHTENSKKKQKKEKKQAQVVFRRENQLQHEADQKDWQKT